MIETYALIFGINQNNYRQLKFHTYLFIHDMKTLV
ncbi:Protein of unknown function [Cotesia congregata]|uniref:Uncharacterized protein n=1 Tax=Cotesia congregata TaxID=51543 RepID=A0A8J2E8P2_COTCN|nr:Protein of unknown function [Cotesia congregata]